MRSAIHMARCFGQGISREGDILDLAVDFNIINKSGAWFAYNNVKIGQGRENAKQYLRENDDVCQEVAQKVRAQVLEKENDEQEKEESVEAFKKKAESADTSKKKDKEEAVKSEKETIVSQTAKTDAPQKADET